MEMGVIYYPAGTAGNAGKTVAVQYLKVMGRCLLDLKG
jgi:hypothetical protein